MICMYGRMDGWGVHTHMNQTEKDERKKREKEQMITQNHPKPNTHTQAESSNAKGGKKSMGEENTKKEDGQKRKE